MRVRTLAAALMLALLGLALLPAPVLAQTDPDECGNFTPLCEGLQDVGDGISPITDGLDAVTDPLAEELEPVLVGIEDLVGQLRGIVGQVTDAIPCGQVQPIIDELQPLLDDAAGILDVATDELVQAAEGLEPILREANALIDDVLDICVAGDDEGRDPTGGGGDGPVPDTATVDVADENTPTLPVTGGGAALGGAVLLGLAGTLAVRMRRR